MNWGLIGGGEGSQIGATHRIAAGLDGEFQLAAGALDIDATRAREYAVRLGISRDRAYGDFEITRAFLQAGFDVLCEKPLTTTLEEAEEIVRTARANGRICAVNYGYSGYALVRHARAMVARGDLGKIRVVVAEFAHGHHANAADADNPRVRWRYDPKLAGISSIVADCGIHALHMATFITGQEIQSLSADFATTLPGRGLEDDALVAFRMSGGAVGRLWTSAVAVGRMHGLSIQVFGEKGGLRWAQEQPNQLYWTPVGGSISIIDRGVAGISAAADRASRVTVGHAEGFFGAFGNIYADLAEQLHANRERRKPNPLALSCPTAEDGSRSIAAVHAAVASAKARGAWVDCVPSIAGGESGAR
jgi:predicted dehydrogenase